MKRTIVGLIVFVCMVLSFGCENPMIPDRDPAADELVLSSLTSSAVVLIPRQEKALGISSMLYLASVADESVAIVTADGLLQGVAEGKTELQISDLNESPLFSVEVVVSTRFETSDSVFEAVLLENYDTDGDGIFTLYEAEGISALNLDGLQISDLTGIKQFTSLKVLSCEGNQFTSLDVAGMSLQSLNLKNCTSLMTLDCSLNEIAWLDLTGAALLQTADLSGNKIPALNLLGCTLIETLDASDNLLRGNLAPELPYLTDLNMGHNLFKILDVSNLPELKRVNLDSASNLETVTGFNGQESVKINNCPKLTSITGSHLKKVVISNCPALNTLSLPLTNDISVENCSGLTLINQSTSWNIPKENQLNALSVIGCGALYRIAAEYAVLDHLITSDTPNLSVLDFRGIKAVRLVIDKIPSLKTLNITNDQVGTLVLWPGYETITINTSSSIPVVTE